MLHLLAKAGGCGKLRIYRVYTSAHTHTHTHTHHTPSTHKQKICTLTANIVFGPKTEEEKEQML